MGMAVPRTILPVALIAIAIATICNAQVGKRCKLYYNGAPGVCKLSTDCAVAKKQASQGIAPTICGFGFNSLPILCCEGAQVEANENSFLGFSPGSSDSFVFQEDTDSNPNQQSPAISLSEQKCIEYSKSIRQEVQILPLFAGATPATVKITKCEYDGVALIVGGTPAALGEFPYMAALGFRNSLDELVWACGATLISEQFVLTAAHCFVTKGMVLEVVRLGELDLESDNDGATPVDFGVAEIIRHPNHQSTKKYNDIALVKLNRTVEFTNHIRPACLWNKPIRHKTSIATGWGSTSYGGDSSSKLLKVTLNVLNNSQCAKVYGNKRHLPDGIVDSMLCAGVLEGNKDTCQGDSGGPLVVTKEDNQCVFYLVGVTSFGIACGLENSPGVYTRVPNFLQWIEKTIW